MQVPGTPFINRMDTGSVKRSGSVKSITLSGNAAPRANTQRLFSAFVTYFHGRTTQLQIGTRGARDAQHFIGI